MEIRKCLMGNCAALLVGNTLDKPQRIAAFKPKNRPRTLTNHASHGMARNHQATP